MESLDALFMMRMTERLLGLLAGGLCVVLGYRLFMNLPEKTDANGQLLLPGGISIWLSRVGPGVFFALFGTAVLGYSFASPVKVTTERVVQATEDRSDPGAAPAVTSRQEIAAMTRSSQSATSKETRERRLIVLRGSMADLNATIGQIERDLRSPEREQLTSGLQATKMLLLRSHWEPSWGDPDRFQSWINTGAVLPAPSGMDEPAALYLAGPS